MEACSEEHRTNEMRRLAEAGIQEEDGVGGCVYTQSLLLLLLLLAVIMVVMVAVVVDFVFLFVAK